MTPRIQCVEDGSFISLSCYDDIICKFFNKAASKVGFSDEYHMLMGVGEVIYRDGKWNDDVYEHVIARLQVACNNKSYFDTFKQAVKELLKNRYAFVI